MEKEIKDLTKEEIINPSFIPSIFENYKDESERQTILVEILEVAKKYRVLGKVNKAISVCMNNTKIINNSIQAILVLNKQGETDITTENYITIMNNDEYIKNLFYYDMFIHQVIYTDKQGKTRWWTDMDDSVLKAYIEKTYGIYNPQKYYDAFNTVLATRKVHPIKNIIERSQWDGKPRIDKFLVNILGCDDDDYTREVSRMIFYGGINRLYNPGCKFDYMPILISGQGRGKSTIISWLALENTYYKDLYTIEGKDGMESLDGAWICEMAELLAMVRTKDVEAMKAFVSRCSDKYRRSYDRRTSDNPRQCIFIGTTNDTTFLVDKTGNRRYLPIVINSDGRELYKKEKQIKKYILNCWREALYLMQQGKTYLSIPVEYLNVVEEKQEQAVMDDPKLGLIIDYLNKLQVGDKISGIELFTKCLSGLKKNYTMLESKEISRIMNGMKNFIKCDKRFFTKDFGQQRGWEKVDYNINEKFVNINIDDEWSDLD